MARKTVDFDTVRELALALPDVQDASGARGHAFKVHGKLLACTAIHSSAEPGTLAVHIAPEVRTELLAADPAAYYVTPHYVGYPMVLVRLARVTPAALRKVLDTSWVFVTSTPSRSRSRPARKKTKKTPSAGKRR